MDAPACRIHKLIADVALVAEGRVLLVKYADTNKYDHQRGWFLPDDLLAHLEHPEHAATRILNEQVNLSVPQVRLSHIESFKGRDGSWHLAFHYKAELDKALPLTPSADIEAAEWFALDHLPSRSEVAHHGWALEVIREALARGARS